MDEAYHNLKHKLEELGYNYTLPVDGVCLIECIVADLLQTTRSLQHYMDLSKEALEQRDLLMMEVEPYKCDNAKLIQKNNHLHREIIQQKEENLKISKENKKKIKLLTEELAKKDATISKLQYDLRDLSLRGLCADTQSSRNKIRKKDGDTPRFSKTSVCNEEKYTDIEKEMSELLKKIQFLEEENQFLCDENVFLKNQIENREGEIIRLNMLLEGGRPLSAINKDYHGEKYDVKLQTTLRQIQDLQNENELLKKEVGISLKKQHEAMLRALTLADENKCLQEELQKVDKLALKVEEECNKKLAAIKNEINFSHTRIESLTLKNSELQKHLSKYQERDMSSIKEIQEALNLASKEKNTLQKEVQNLIELNKTLQDKISSLSMFSKNYYDKINADCQSIKHSPKCLKKDELQQLLLDERSKYEKYMVDIQHKLSDAMNLFNKYMVKNSTTDPKNDMSSEKTFIKELKNRLCESEQKILMLKKENDEFKSQISSEENGNRKNYQDIINHLNAENALLSQENLSLSQQLKQYKLINNSEQMRDNYSIDIRKLKEENAILTHNIELLKKDKQEYQVKYNEANELVEKLKRELTFKQKEIECMEAENCSYKMTNRTGKASAEQLKDECKFLKEQIKQMQNDVIKEKTLASQIKNLQLETERNSTEIQNELMCTQRKLSLSKDTIALLEKKCKELQSEIMSLQNDKSNLIDNIKRVDQDRDKLIMDLDNKIECMNELEHKIKTQAIKISQLDNENLELKKKLNDNKTYQHRLSDYESQISFLNSEILRLTQQYDTAVIENKHLQNSLADTNGKLKLTKLELEKSKKEVDGLKKQLQHYVAEVRRIEELLSQKEAERSDMLEQFASLSVEANILENNNHSLESESASKTIQLQAYVNKIESLEAKISDKDKIIDSKSACIAAMTCKVTTLENEIRLILEEKKILEQNVTYLKQMCDNLKSDKSNRILEVRDTDSELMLYENKIKSLSNLKARLQDEIDKTKEKLNSTEKLLSNARREIVDLKLALQDATSETKSLQDCINRLRTPKPDFYDNTLMKDDLDLPLALEETIHEVSHEDEDSLHSNSNIHKSYFKYSHGSTI